MTQETQETLVPQSTHGLFSSALIIEDDPFQRSVLSWMVKKLCSGSVRIAENGHQALLDIEAHGTPDLIVCDLQMPEMDGVEFLRILSSMELDSKIVLVSATEADVIESVRQMAVSYGISRVSVLKKPINYDELQSALEKFEYQHEEPKTQRKQIEFSKQELQQAFAEDQICPYFQPHADAKTGRIIGAESLIRWEHPKHGVLTPELFLDQIYEYGLADTLTYHVLSKSVEACAAWLRAGITFHVSVNVAPSDLVKLDFADLVFDILQKNRLPARQLTIEITETEIRPHLARSLDTMSRLRMHGVGVSLDDFGTGHSSLSQLLSSPFTEVKVDRCFVQYMHVSNRHHAAVESQLMLANRLGMQTVAEGVELPEHVTLLSEMGCNVLQGYLYSHALSQDEFFSWASRQLSQSN